ncbi:MAG: hypothetical protein WC867_07805 [Candidatus Pacearchaeota archaeon]|jgi:hypothetical protein
MKTNIRKNSRHLRWNWHLTDEIDSDGRNYLRYHFVVVDDRNREGILGKILENLARYSEAIQIRREDGKVKDSDLRYLFCSYDSLIKPEMINWSNINKPIKRDLDLRERKIGNIEDYVASLYS